MFFFFFAWSASLEKILTMDNLKKRHVIVVDGCFHKRNGESVDHILLYCEVSCALWNAIFTLGCPGLCLIEWLICLLVGGRVVVLGVLSCGR